MGNQESIYRPRLHQFSVICVFATFVAVLSGGNVTSRDAGLAVPDGFRVFDHFLWTFPFTKWIGNIFHEHIHRLNGSVIGILLTVMAIWLCLTQKNRLSLRMIGLMTLAMVLIQGLLGAWRVNMISTFYAVLHGIHGQLILCMTVLIASATSRWWIEQMNRHGTGEQSSEDSRLPGKMIVTMSVLFSVLLIQLILGATMRHTGAGLAIPDFPSSYGRLVPPFGELEIIEAHDGLVAYDEASQIVYPTPWQVGVHFAHRIWALVTLAGAGYALAKLAGTFGRQPALVGPMIALVILLLVQGILGAAVIWTGRLANIATGHQATGAVTLAVAFLLIVRVWRLMFPVRREGSTTCFHPATAHVQHEVTGL